MTNDVHSEEFESKMDKFFRSIPRESPDTQALKKHIPGKAIDPRGHRDAQAYAQWMRNIKRKALGRNSCKGQLGVSSPVRKK